MTHIEMQLLQSLKVSRTAETTMSMVQKVETSLLWSVTTWFVAEVYPLMATQLNVGNYHPQQYSKSSLDVDFLLHS